MSRFLARETERETYRERQRERPRKGEREKKSHTHTHARKHTHTALPYPGHKTIKTFADGSRFEGEWKYGRAHGEGQMRYGTYAYMFTYVPYVP